MLSKLKEKLQEKNLIKLKISDIKFKKVVGYKPIKRELIGWSESQKSLKEKITNEGYKPDEYGYPIVCNKNICINGHHRFVILKELYGDDYEITVNKVNINWGRIFFVGLLASFFGYK